MSEQILDGKGTGNKARVASDNRLQVRSISEPEIIHNGELGNAYNFNTGNISLGADATLIYFKNNANDNFILESIILAIDSGITYTTFPYITAVRNPTGGDLITDATAISMNQNRNFGSSKTATVDVYKGKASGTLTGGDNIALFQVSQTGRSVYPVNFILPKGSSIGITLDLNASSGSANIYCALVGYFKDDLDSE